MEPSPFKQAIQEHLMLRKKNRLLEAEMPLARYRSTEAVGNHAMFKSESDVAREGSLEGGQDDWALAVADSDLLVTEELWSRSPSFEWGD